MKMPCFSEENKNKLGEKIFWLNKILIQKILGSKNILNLKHSGPKYFLLINKTFSVISNWIYSPFNNLTFAQQAQTYLFSSHKQGIFSHYNPFNNLTFAQPYVERTFTMNSSVAQLLFIFKGVHQ